MPQQFRCLRINEKLIPVKLMYFTSVAAIGSLIPFIPVYMKGLGLSSTETGIIYGVIPFISFFTRPLIGAFADKIRHHKGVLISSLLCMGLFYGLLLVTPRNTVDCVAHMQRFSEELSNNNFDRGCGNIRNLTLSNSSDLKSCAISFLCDEDETLENVTRKKEQTFDIRLTDGEIFTCYERTSGEPAYECSVTADLFGRTFIVFLTIYSFACISFSSIYSLMDAMAYDILGDKRDLWGRQRLWGTVGFAMSALASSFAVDIRSRDSTDSQVDYSVSFYIFIGLCVTSAIISSRLKISEALQCKHLFQNVTRLLFYPEILAFMIVITFIGIFFAVIQGFMFWYLQDLGSTQLTLGLCLVTNCVAEVAVLAYGGKIIKLIGHAACLYVALLAYTLRFMIFSVLTNVWLAPLVELLHGLCFGLMYDAATEYASIIAPKAMSATVQGVIGGLYFGFGRGIGGLVTGKLFDPTSGLGAIWTFRVYGCVSLFVLVVYAVLNAIVFRRPTRMPRNINMEITTEQTGNCSPPVNVNQSDYLVLILLKTHKVNGRSRLAPDQMTSSKRKTGQILVQQDRSKVIHDAVEVELLNVKNNTGTTE